MNKQTIITILLALVAMAGQGQIHYRLEGNTGRPDVTDTLSVIENRGFEENGNILSKTIDTLYIVNVLMYKNESRFRDAIMPDVVIDGTKLYEVPEKWHPANIVR